MTTPGALVPPGKDGLDWTTTLVKLRRDIFGARMRVSEQHPGVAMTADESYFRHIQTLLKKPADGLVAQIVKPQVLQPGPFHQSLPRHLRRVLGDRQDARVLSNVVPQSPAGVPMPPLRAEWFVRDRSW